ncbi:MliC family protein [Pararhizobium haloflavum]|uniref:MliC family protein n=1 Tax=Pararhizobium haloflavum TaxID=2037914 RepID=UPI000C199127|nr:MliC family protein [Pararhizobium haloflavum]
MFRFLTGLLAATAIFIGAHAAAASQDASPGYASAVYGYTCADGTAIDVAYINMKDGLALAVVKVDDELLVMENVVSGSGARYATTSGDERYVWWSHQNEGFLQMGPDGEEEMVHTACQ